MFYKLGIPEQAQRGLRSCDTEASHGLIAYSNVSAEIGQSGCVRRHPCLASSRAVLALSQAYLNKGCTTLHPKQNSLASLCQIKMSKRLNTASIDLTTHFRPTSTQRATALVARCTPPTSCPDPASCTQCWADSGSLPPALTGMRYIVLTWGFDRVAFKMTLQSYNVLATQRLKHTAC